MISIDFKSFFKKRRKLPSGFPTGMVLFTGRQGRGKSLCQSRYAYQLQEKWGAKVYSATDYKYAHAKIEEDAIPQHILTKREDRPTIFLLDEIQVLLDAENIGKQKSQITKAIQQQRKRNTSIIGTVQIYVDLDPIYRRQVAYVVKCSKFGPIQVEQWLDGESMTIDPETKTYSGKTVAIKIWKRHNEMYDLYDTYEVVGVKKQLKGSSP